jgi:hypothetical protein
MGLSAGFADASAPGRSAEWVGHIGIDETAEGTCGVGEFR